MALNTNTSSSLRQRIAPKEKKSSSVQPAPREDQNDGSAQANAESSGGLSIWSYRLALGIITAGAFITRFWGINHPNEVVFDEVHFGKVCT